MILGRYRQVPGERRKRGIDFSDFLESGEIVSTCVPTVTPTTDPPLVVADIVIDSAGKKLAYYVSGGIDGQTYSCVFATHTSGTQDRRDTIEFDVEEDES